MLTPIHIDSTDADALIEAPGLYCISEAAYHADSLCIEPALSSSIARTLLNQSPAHAYMEHPRLAPGDEEDDEPTEAKATMDVGSAAHAMLLGRGADMIVVEADDWRTKAAKEARDAARDAGKTPILAKQHRKLMFVRGAAMRQIGEFADVLPDLLGPNTLFEHVIYWQEQGVWCRAMIDALQILPDRINIVDYKSTESSAHPLAFSRQAANMGYDFQLAWYRRAVRRIVGPNDRRPIRCFLMPQERAKPYALSVIEAGEDTLMLGDKMGAAALQVWSRCMQANEWPAYPPIVATMTVPGWRETQWLEREVNDDALAGAGWKFSIPLAPDVTDTPADVLAAG